MKPTYDKIKDMPPELEVPAPGMLYQAVQTMLMFGVERFDMGHTPHGPIYVLEPKIKRMNLPREIPDTLKRTQKNVFKHWAEILVLFGFTSIVLNSGESDREKTLKMWEDMDAKRTSP